MRFTTLHRCRLRLARGLHLGGRMRRQFRNRCARLHRGRPKPRRRGWWRRSPTTARPKSCRGSTARWSPTGRRKSPGATRRSPAYLNDDDPARAAKYGFRSGQTPATGLVLVPRQPGRVQRRALRAVQDDPRSRSRTTPTRRCGPSPGSGSVRPWFPTATGASDLDDGPHRRQSRARRTTTTASRAPPARRRCRTGSRSRTRGRSSR